MEYEIIVLGTGPAGLSAAIAARSRGKGVLVIGNRPEDSPLARAERIDNYAGLPGLTGRQLLDAMLRHAREQEIPLLFARVNAMLPLKKGFTLTAGSEVYQCGALVLAPGVVRASKLPGEGALLGRGVSYCATCDGMLYRNRRVMVVGRSPDAPEEANFLHKIGCQVTYVSPKRPGQLVQDIPHLSASRLEVLGEERVTALRCDGEDHPCDGVFILRPALAPTDLLPSLALEGGAVVVDRSMATNLPGVYAAGDCTGRPYQVAKAVGEGLVAGEAAADFLDPRANS